MPRATERATWERWKLVMRATAITASVYVVSVNRPDPEGAGIGGPSFAVGPDGEILAETETPRVVVELSRECIKAERRRYPGYLPVYCKLYAASWTAAIDH